jgi:hydroxymethylbilane synthase
MMFDSPKGKFPPNLQRIRLGTRGSALAQRQAALAAEALRSVQPLLEIDVRIITTTGDRVTDVPLSQMVAASGGQGVFTSNLEMALIAGEIDIAIHSLKDLPTEITPETLLGAVLERENVADVLISRDGHWLETLPHGATVGTSSTRRAAQLWRKRPDLYQRDLRGNVDTRVSKALAVDGDYDAVVLAAAGLSRLGKLNVASEILSLDTMLPAPGQAAIAIQCRDETVWRDLLIQIDHYATRIAVSAERAFLRGLGGGCAVPVAAYGEFADGMLSLRGRVLSPDGLQQIESTNSALIGAYAADAVTQAEAVGLRLAEGLLELGAESLMRMMP